VKVTRFYQKKSIDLALLRALEDVLAKVFKWELSYKSYYLIYPSEARETVHMHEADDVARKKGVPHNLRASYGSKGGRMLMIETRVKPGISIDLESKEDDPDPILDRIQTVLSLELIGEVPTDRKIRSAFIAHGFHTDGETYAHEVSRFLGLLGIRCYSGRAFAPKRVSEKVLERLRQHDIFLAILTSQEDQTWITQETATAAAFEKELFILKEADVDVKTGILGDLEYISFPKKQISKTFIPILEGLNALQGLETCIASTPTPGPFGLE
jgi:hypothetical protein